MARRLLKFAFVLLILATAGLGAGFGRLWVWAGTTRALSGPLVFEVNKGQSLSSLATDLERAGIVDSAPMFQAWVRMNRTFPRFQAGRYRVETGVSPEGLVQMVSAGRVWTPVVLQVVIPEGWPLKSVIERLAANGVASAGELRRLASDPTFLKSLRVPGKTLEGFLYPATYDFHTQPTAGGAFSKMVETFWANLPKDYEQQVKSRGLTLTEAVTFASLIEAETMHDDEKSMISEVIWRRLKDRVPLGIDAALIYGIPDYDGDIKWSHLSDAKNPYNTRIHLGMPPTPIGSPGVKALEAVLTPTEFGFYYYVAAPGETRHRFSRTLKEHNENVKKLVKQTKENGNGNR